MEEEVEVTWVDDPTAMPRASSILFLQAKMMAAACSAALPTMGMTMVPRNSFGTPQSWAAPSSASTMNSLRKATNTWPGAVRGPVRA